MTSEQIAPFPTEGTRTGKLAGTMADGSPHVMPVWFIVEGGAIVFNITPQRRIALRDVAD